MNPLKHLASLLLPVMQESAEWMPSGGGIDVVIAQMEARFKSRRVGQIPEDHQLEAVRRFWQSQEILSFRDAYLLSWSLCLPHRPWGPCVMEDRARLEKVLDGADGWSGRPSAYRRCYQGLVKSYFTYDTFAETTPEAGRNNWQILRQYLFDHNSLIKDHSPCPQWVDTAVGNPQLFGEQPCELYADALLRGDGGIIEHLCEQLGISKASWFLRELVLAQVRGATRLANTQFLALLPRLLELLAANEVLRDRGMILVLDRYSEVPGTVLHPGLRDYSVAWWGNPWLPSNETRWGGVTPEARTMVADWLKLEFIETFFTKLAEDGLGDPRRMNFWKRYVKSIDHIEFGLGSFARNSRERDFVVLREKMAGLVLELDAPGANNAFIMTIGNLVVVEFSGLGNALYGYDARRSLPFNTNKTLTLPASSPNSLKQKGRSILWLKHKDGIHNWDKWEDMFEATLSKEFGIEASRHESVVDHSLETLGPRTPGASFQPYSRAALSAFAREHGVEIDDKRSSGGNLWVRAGGSDELVNQLLTQWGFRFKIGKGWWK
jgi:hypothetical protein